MAQRVGILLINLGTPQAPEPRAVRRYLAEFLSDPRVIEIPKFAWKPILHGFVLRTRPAKSAHAYRTIWTEKGSPLAVNSAEQAQLLQQAFGDQVIIDYAMRYGEPAIAQRLQDFVERGCDRILLAPLYPQYSAATTATALDTAFDALASMRAQPAIRTLPPYFAHPSYVGALATSITSSLAGLDFAPDALVASFHGMPVRTAELGDPYFAQCQETTRLLGKTLGREIQIAFQSRFGRAKWFEPATDTLLAGLPARGVRNVAIFCPGFSVDCVETLEEIAIRARDTFLGAGGERFAYLPCLNAEAAGVAMLTDVLTVELAGWIGQSARHAPAVRQAAA